MSINDQPDFLGLFLEEAEDILARIESTILLLNESQEVETYVVLFRDIHTLKGSSKAVGLKEFGNFLHRVEDLVSELKSESLAWSGGIEEILSQSLNILESWIAGLADDSDFTLDTSKVLVAIDNQLQQHTAKESNPTGLTLFEDEEPLVDKNIGDILKYQGKVSEHQLTEAARLQNRKFGEVLVEEGIVAQEDVKDALDRQKNSPKTSQSRKSIRIAQEKVDRLLKSVNQLVIFQSVIAKSYRSQSFDQEVFATAVHQASKVASEVQDISFSFRLQPVKSMFQKLVRVIKDVARDTNKPVNVKTVGDDVELDKFVLEQLQDPLVHVVRNAVDHGIESDRSAKNDRPGTLLLKAENMGSHVIITVEDDGKGIDPMVVKARAIDKKLISPDQKLTEGEIFDLIMLPGFSTAQTVTTFSGRGVGMNVVKSTVEDCGGSIDIHSKVGEGSTFKIKLPTSIGIIKSLIVTSNQRKYAVPLSEISEILDRDECEVKSTVGGGMLSLRGNVVPVQRLADYIKVEEASQIEALKQFYLVASYNGEKIALSCDEMHGVESVIINDLSKGYEGCMGVSGTTILPNGEPSLIISISEICNSYFKKFKNNKEMDAS